MTMQMTGITAVRPGLRGRRREAGASPDGMAGTALGTEGMVVLLVEDDESFSDPLSYMLRKQGFEVVVCRSGCSALETFGRRGADLVLLGLMFTEPLGAEVCRKLRQWSDVPVIMLTTGGETGKVATCEHCAFDYMAVPFTWRELLARIGAVLPAREDSGEVPLTLVP